MADIYCCWDKKIEFKSLEDSIKYIIFLFNKQQDVNYNFETYNENDDENNETEQISLPYFSLSSFFFFSEDFFKYFNNLNNYNLLFNLQKNIITDLLKVYNNSDNIIANVNSQIVSMVEFLKSKINNNNFNIENNLHTNNLLMEQQIVYKDDEINIIDTSNKIIDLLSFEEKDINPSNYFNEFVKNNITIDLIIKSIIDGIDKLSENLNEDVFLCSISNCSDYILEPKNGNLFLRDNSALLIKKIFSDEYYDYFISCPYFFPYNIRFNNCYIDNDSLKVNSIELYNNNNIRFYNYNSIIIGNYCNYVFLPSFFYFFRKTKNDEYVEKSIEVFDNINDLKTRQINNLISVLDITLKQISQFFKKDYYFYLINPPAFYIQKLYYSFFVMSDKYGFDKDEILSLIKNYILSISDTTEDILDKEIVFNDLIAYQDITFPFYMIGGIIHQFSSLTHFCNVEYLNCEYEKEQGFLIGN